MNAPQNTPAGNSGFVLPYVLVVIAILAIAGTIAAQRLQKANEIVTDMQDRARAERVLLSAEAAATYSLLTGNPVIGGYDISPESPIAWEFGLLSSDGRRPLREDAASAIAKDIWPGNGSLRRYNITTPNSETSAEAIVSYRDASGLVSLNSGNPDHLQAVLEAAGAKPAQARKMLTALADYTDADENKRPNGAESFNYRTQNLQPPTNSPLRSYSELGRVMGWAEALPTLDMRTLKDMTTLQMGSGYRQNFASTDLRQMIGPKDSDLTLGLQLDIMQQVELNNNEPSQLARFTIWAARSDGRYQKRVVDIERFMGGIGEPYRRHWVYDSTVLESDLTPYVGTPRSTISSPLQFDELDHVVHATALRP